MFVESGAVYSIRGMVYIVSHGLTSSAQNILLPCLGQLIVSAFLPGNYAILKS